MSAIAPVSGPTTGGTAVQVIGTFTNSSDTIVVRFTDGTDTRDVVGSFVSATRVDAVTVAFPSAGTVNVTVALNGQQFTTTSVPFLFYGTLCGRARR